MAKRKNAVLTDEEKKEKARKDWEADIRLFPSICRSEPTYSFSVGDWVVLGNRKDPVIEESLMDGRAYLVRAKELNGDGVDYTVAPWYSIRPISIRTPYGLSSFSKNDELRLSFNNSTVSSLLHRYFYFGVFMDPDYQRGYVWDDKDRESLLDSIFYNADIGKMVFNSPESKQDGDMYEIIDGKQRLSTLVSYYENRWAYRGLCYNDLSGKDRYRFLNHPIMYADLTGADKAEVLKVFLVLNKGGKPMDPGQIRKVEKLYELEMKRKGEE